MIGVLVSGEGTNLQALIDAGLPIVAVASNNTKARALDRAAAAGIEAGAFPAVEFDTREARDVAMAEWLEERGVELVVCAGYMHLLRLTFLSRFPDKVVNVHPALLPAFPGAHAVEDALAAGVSRTGATATRTSPRSGSTRSGPSTSSASTSIRSPRPSPARACARRTRSR